MSQSPPSSVSPGPKGLPEGVPSSLPWLVGLVLFSPVLLCADGVVLVSNGLTASIPLLLVGLTFVAVGAGVTAAFWLWSRHRALVELGCLVGSLGPDPSVDQVDAMISISPRLTGPFPVREDDELGFLAARLNGLAYAMDRMLEQVRDERARVVNILASMDSGVVVTDYMGRVTYANPAAGKLAGRSVESLVGRTLLESLLKDDLASRVNAAVRSGDASSLTIHMDAARRHVLARVSPLSHGRAGAVIVLQDQEEQKRLDSVRRDFVANVSHELRTPLASIRAMAETLLLGALDDPEAADRFLGIIIQETDRLAGLTNDLLDLARYESGRLEVAPVDLNDLLAEVKSQVGPNAARSHLELRTNMEHLANVTGDRAALRQVFLNLVENAVKYTSSGSITLSAAPAHGEPHTEGAVCIQSPRDRNGAGPSQHWIRIQVEDTGPGIAGVHLHRIFERFYRADPARSRELGGTGLGLSIVRHVVESHGGCIEVSSKVGEGSTFTIWLPSLSDESAA